jgi:hypothetical protein
LLYLVFIQVVLQYYFLSAFAVIPLLWRGVRLAADGVVFVAVVVAVIPLLWRGGRLAADGVVFVAVVVAVIPLLWRGGRLA